MAKHHTIQKLKRIEKEVEAVMNGLAKDDLFRDEVMRQLSWVRVNLQMAIKLLDN